MLHGEFPKLALYLLFAVLLWKDFPGFPCHNEKLLCVFIFLWKEMVLTVCERWRIVFLMPREERIAGILVHTYIPCNSLHFWFDSSQNGEMLSNCEQYSNEGTGVIFHTDLLGKVLRRVWINLAKLDKWQWQSCILLLSSINNNTIIVISKLLK